MFILNKLSEMVFRFFVFYEQIQLFPNLLCTNFTMFSNYTIEIKCLVFIVKNI